MEDTPPPPPYTALTCTNARRVVWIKKCLTRSCSPDRHLDETRGYVDKAPGNGCRPQFSTAYPPRGMTSPVGTEGG